MAAPQGEERKYNTQATDNNYWQAAPFDFDPKNRPTILPHDSFGKHYLSDYFTNPGNDWEAAAP